jgi:lambda family phage portal protein
VARVKHAWRQSRGQGIVTRALSTFGGLFGSPAASGYAGGRLTRLTADWVMLPLSADQELRWNLRALRARARELVRDNPFAKRFIHLIAQNVVGHHGIQLQARVTTLKGEPHAGVNATLEQEWRLWGQAENCSVDGRLDFGEFQRLVIKTVAQDGECIIRLVRGFDNPWAFALQLIDADQLDHMYNRPGNATAGENEIRLGVELDKWRRPLTYWLWSGHPSEYEYEQSRQRVPVPAAEIIHLYVSHRVGQTRGVSWFHPVLLQLKMLDGYHEAELVAARTAAAKFWVITSTSDEGYQAPIAGEKVEMEVEPGMLTELDPGKSITPLDPQHPVAAFEQFSKSILKGIASGLGVTYADLAGDLGEANFANARTGLLAARDEYRSLQQWFIEHFHRRVYNAWLSMATLAGRIKPGMRDPESLKDVEWVPRGFDWVDPLADMRANALAIDYGLTSRTRLAAAQGEDLTQIFADLADEEKMAKENGITLAPEAVKPTAKAPSESNPAPGVDAEPAGGGNGGGRATVLDLLRR